ERDLETHGTVTIYTGGAEEWGYEKEFREDRTYGMLCHDTRFEQAFLDRVQRNVERDKNNAAVVLWSLGNESGYGPNPEKAAAWIKSFDKHMLVHYESSIHQMKGYKNNISNIDVFSHMYAPTEAIDTIVKTFLNKPFIQCEFVHAMGNGPGDIEDYFEQIYAYDEFAGGFVWEWCDHAVWMGTTVEGKDKFYYGGDFGEFPHDGNFCIDGLVYPDRRIHTGLLEWKNCARPMRVYDVDISKGIVRIANKTDFTNLKDMLNVHFEVSQDGNIIETGIIDDLDILPHTEKEIRLNFTVPHEGNSYIRIISTQKYDSDFIKAGYELGFDQLCICKAEKKPHILTNPLPVTIAESETEFLLSSKDFRYSFNRLTGMFDTLVKDNVSLLCAPMECNIWRAPTDNDRVIRQDWENAGYDRKTIKVYESDIAQNDSCVIIRVRMAISAVFIQRIANIEAVWTIHNDGSIQVHMDVARNTDLPYLPRFGLRMMLAKTFNTVQYEGYGPNESYIDKHRSSYYGKFTSKVCDMHEDYIKPQENSSRWGCSEVCLFDKNYAVKICSDRFSFNVSEYTQEELACKKHNFELEKSNATVLCLDSAMSGIGSGSCGPQLKPCYQVNDAHFTLDFMLQFFSAENY
ncbi:MAG: glycoside hydrolase family 2 TIM barrel-domain containing protein, partial [Spirochaetales bacterium]